MAGCVRHGDLGTYRQQGAGQGGAQVLQVTARHCQKQRQFGPEQGWCRAGTMLGGPRAGERASRTAGCRAIAQPVARVKQRVQGRKLNGSKGSAGSSVPPGDGCRAHGPPRWRDRSTSQRNAAPAAGMPGSPSTVIAAVTPAAATAALRGAMKPGRLRGCCISAAARGRRRAGRLAGWRQGHRRSRRSGSGSQSPDICQRDPRGLWLAGVDPECGGTGTYHVKQELLRDEHGMAIGKAGRDGTGEVR